MKHLLVLAASAVLLFAPPGTAHAGDIKFAVAQDYPSSTVTYLGTASPGAIAHFYRDGRADKNADMVIGNTGGGPVVVYGVGGGRFSTQRNIVNNSDTDASAVQVADFNADGIPDIVSGGYTTERITVLLGQRDGSFGVAAQYPLQGVWPSQFGIADFNRDGHLDIAVSAYGGGSITILLGKGDGTFREAPPVPATHVALAMLVTDFDGDGIPDMAVTETFPTAGTPGDASSNLFHGEVQILLGNGDGTFRLTHTYAIGALSEVIRYGDIDEDGKGDLVILNSLINNEASILYGLGGGRFAPEQRMRFGGPSSINILDVRSGDGAEGLQLVDFNRDGHLDMAVTQMISSRLVVFQGDGRRHFTPAGSYDVAGFPEDLMAGDLDGDGCPDLAVPGNMPPIGPSDVGVGRVSVLLNMSTGCQKAFASRDLTSVRLVQAPRFFARGRLGYSSLVVRGVPAGGRVELGCRGGRNRGCTFARRVVTSRAGGSVSLTSRVRSLRLRRGAYLVVRVTGAGARGRQITLRYTRAGSPPSPSVRCIPPGAGTAGRC